MSYINTDAHKTVSRKALPSLFCLVQTEFLALIDESKVRLQYLPTSLIE